MKFYAAPLQGYTEAPLRHFHAAVYGRDVDSYFSPFLRVEKGVVRARDLRDITSPLCSNHHVVPQIIFRDADEFKILVSAVKAAGYTAVDLNLGCPFPPQVRKGRGAGFLRRIDDMRSVADMIGDDDAMTYSVKMRLGVDSPDEWLDIIRMLNVMRLDHVTVHPRVAAQQYRGDLYHESFVRFLGMVEHPVVFNGDIVSLCDIEKVRARYPELSGIMIGRGLLGRPSLIAEWVTGEEWSRERRLSHLRRLHDGVFGYYVATLSGESQILSKVKPFWEYLEQEIGHRAAKMIYKSSSVSAYRAAVNQALASDTRL